MKNEKLILSVKDSLSELKRRTDIITEQRSILVSELADVIIGEFGSDSPEMIYREFLSAIGGAEVTDKLTFTHKLTENYSSQDLVRLLLSADSDDFAPAGAHGKISYIRNRYNDEAYSKFSSVIPHAKPVYRADFEECCDAISAGEAEFTVLPLEDSVDGTMFGFYSLLDRYGLKIVNVCNIEREDSSKVIRYALAGRYFKSDHSEREKKDAKRIFEFTMTHSPSTRLIELFSAATLCNAVEHRATSLPLPFGDNMARFYHSFVITKKTHFLPFLLFLSLEYPQYSPIGIYREI